MRVLGLLFALLLLAGPVRWQQVAPHRPGRRAARPPGRRPRLDTLDVSHRPRPAFDTLLTADTLLRLEGRRYRLRLSAAAPDGSVLTAATRQGTRFAAVATLFDAAGHRLFRRVLPPRLFEPVLGSEWVWSARPFRPVLAGYNAPRGWLLLRVDFGGLSFDEQLNGLSALVALDRQGRVQRVLPSYGYPTLFNDCVVQSSPDGQAILTCTDLLLPGNRRVPLYRPGRLVRAAHFLSDTVVLVVYAYVQVGPHSGLRPPPGAKRWPNVYLLSARTGRVLGRFRYDPDYGTEDSGIRRCYVWQNRTYYLPDESYRAVYVLPKDQPGRVRRVDYRRLPRFRPPRRVTERALETGEYEVRGDSVHYAHLYVDFRTGQLRYEAVAGER